MRHLHSLTVAALIAGATEGHAVSKDKNTLVYGESARLETIDPYTIHEASGRRLGDLLFDSLIEVGPGGNYKPALASSWVIENSGAAVTFELRDGVVWHGKKARLTADDIVTTVRLLLSPESEIPNKERFNVIKRAEVITPQKVRIHLTRAMVDPLRALMFKVLPHHSLGSVQALTRKHPFTKAPIGTGPYVLEKLNDQGEILLAANDRYWGGVPKIKKVVMKPFADQNVMAQSLMFQSLDLVTYVSPKDLSEIKGDQHLGLIPYDALSFSFFAMNTARGILKDKRVRKAIGYAVNRQEMLNAFFQGKGALISGPFPPTSWAYNLDVKPMNFDTAKSAALFAEAGLKKDGEGRLLDRDGKPVKLLFAVPVAGESEMIKRIVLAFQGYLANVGVQLDLQFMDWLVWKERVMKAHDYDLTIASWSFDDASNITSLFHSSSSKAWGNNFVQFQNAQVDSLLTEAGATNDFDKKRTIYQKLHTLLADEAPYTYLWTLTHHAAHNVRVKGVKIEPYSFFKHIVGWRLTGNNHDRAAR